MSAQPQFLDAVLPLAMRDMPFARLLMRSIDCFLPDVRTCFVVTPDAEADEARREFRGGRYEVIAESTLVPEFKRFPRIRGWTRQQLVKLAIAERVETPFYLTLDADVLAVRLTRASDLIIDGRALARRSQVDQHPDWYAWAERILGLPRSGLTHAVTPALMARDGVLSLQEHIRAGDPPWRRLLRWLAAPKRLHRRLLLSRSWRRDLLLRVPWTEYALYFTYLEATGQFERYHLDCNHDLYGNSVWRSGQFAAWDPAASFRGPPPFFFSVLQSNADVDPDELARRVAPYLDGYVLSFTIPGGDRVVEQAGIENDGARASN